MLRRITIPNFVTAYLLHTFLVLLFISLSYSMIPNDPAIAGFINPNLNYSIPFLADLLRCDAHWYTYIAENGYTSFSIVFFPLLIVLIRLAAYSGISFALAGLLICNIFAFFSFFLMEKLYRLDHTPEETYGALIIYGIFPTSFFINSIYTEPVFLVFSMACIYFLRIGKWWLSGIAASLAVLTRNVGIFLVLYMIYESWLMYLREGRFRLYNMSLLLPLLSLSAFAVYNYILLGNPLAFVSSQELWGRDFNYPWFNIIDSFNQLLSSPLLPNLLDLLIVFLCLLGLLAATFIPKYKVHCSMLITGWAWFFVPLFSRSSILPLCSASRYMLVLLPLYSFLSRIPKPHFYLFITISIYFLYRCTISFANWYFIA